MPAIMSCLVNERRCDCVPCMLTADIRTRGSAGNIFSSRVRHARAAAADVFARQRKQLADPQSPSQAANHFFETGEVFRKQASNGPVHDKRLLGLASHSI